MPFEFLTASFSACSPLSHIPTQRAIFFLITNTRRFNFFKRSFVLGITRIYYIACYYFGNVTFSTKPRAC